MPYVLTVRHPLERSFVMGTMTTQRITLAVDCKERWEGMTSCAGGRFCGACAKPVIDFTTWPRADMLRHLEAHPDACGQYLPEQLDPSLVPMTEVVAKARRGFFAALAAFALNAVHAQQKADPVPTEQTVPDRGAKSAATASGAEHNGPGKVSVENGHDVCPVPESPEVASFQVHKHLYWSRRFPFFRVHRPYRGRVRRQRLIF